MKLSQDILFYRIFLNYPAQFLKRNETDLKYGYPVIYESGTDLSGRAVIIRTKDLEALPNKEELSETLFVCIGAVPRGIEKIPAVILIENSVSPVGVNNYLIQTYDEFEAWDAALKKVVRMGGTFQDLINCCDSIITEPIAIIDKEFRTIAESKLSLKLDYDNELDDDKTVPEDFVSPAAEVDDSSFFTLNDSYIFPSGNERHLGRNIFDKKEFVGRIAIHLSANDPYLQNYYNAILDYLYVCVTNLYSEYSSFEVREISNNRLATLLRNSLNKKKISEKLWEEAFEENGWTKNSHFILVQFLPHSLEENNIRNIYSTVLNFKENRLGNVSLCFIYMERLLMFIDIEKLTGFDKLDLFDALVDFSKSNLLVAGISRVFSDMKYLRPAYDQTKTAIEYGTTLHPSGFCYKFDDYALDYMLRNSIGTFENEEICSSKLISLLQYDAEKGTDYYKTLYIYFQCKFNSTEAAKMLFINRSTFHYRLERIQELVSIDFNSEDERLYLAISFKILEQLQNNM